MKIFNAQQIRDWDQYTTEHEPIESIELMERAAKACFQWILKNYQEATNFSIFCGKGNNGGDGLAIARMLMSQKYQVSVYILEFGHKGTDDFQTNLAGMHAIQGNDIHFIQSVEQFKPFQPDEIIIDALFGSGLNRKLEGITADLVRHINESACTVISIDIPSGIFVDHSSKKNIAVHATHTLTFQCWKPCFLMAENENYFGQLHILQIGLNENYYEKTETAWELTDPLIIHSVFKKRRSFSHKGNFGHAFLLAGSSGKSGAAILAAKACLRSGAGLLTCHLPSSCVPVLQSSFPEAMVETDLHHSMITRVSEELSKFNAIGIGPGIGTHPETILLLKDIFEEFKSPVVIDADALNCISINEDLLDSVPAGSILTPHPKEFERLFGETADEFERIDLAIKKANDLNIVIVMKGHHTCIASAKGKIYFNSTGNAGMATAGAGDVLTGILTGLLAQGYSSVESAILGVYLHGLAGDLAARSQSPEAMIASDIIDNLGEAFLTISTPII